MAAPSPVVQEAKKEEPTPAPAPTTTIREGQKVELSGVSLYTSSTAKNPSGKKTGTYFIYDGKVLNGRIRITNSSSNVGKTPVGNYVTGWVNESDIK